MIGVLRILPLLLLASGCASASDARGAESTEAQRLELGLGQSDSAAGLVVRFVRVVGDSRCPEGVNCVWAGDAEVEIELNGEEIRALHTNLEPKAIEVDGVAVVLIDLRPYPHIDVPVDPADLLLVLDVGGALPAPSGGERLAEARSVALR